MVKEKGTKKGGRVKIIGIIVAVIIILAIIGSIGGNDGSQQVNNSQMTEAVSETEADQGADVQETTTAAATDEQSLSSPDSIEVSDFTVCPSFTAEQGTTEMVDQISLVAQNNVGRMTDDDVSNIIKIISDADHKFYNNPEEMERFMWYGYLLDHKFDDSDPRSALGMDLYQAIKYVYRGVETIFDDATHENLSQIDVDLLLIEQKGQQ